MAVFSRKDQQLFDEFKKEAKIVELKSSASNTTKKVVKWRGRIFNNSSFRSVFEIIKTELKK